MANEIRINTDRLDKDVQELRRLIAVMEEEIMALKTDISHLSSLCGEAGGQTLIKTLEADRAAAEALIRELQSLQVFGDQARALYEQCEGRVLNLVDSIR